MSQKISKSHFYVRWHLFAVYLHKEPQGEKSQKVKKKLQKVTWNQMRYVCSVRSNMCHRLRQQGGSQMRYVCSVRSNMCHMVEAAGWVPDAVHFRNWCPDVAKVFKKCGLDAVPFRQRMRCNIFLKTEGSVVKKEV